MKTYNVGILGAGMMGKTHAWCWQSLPYYYENLPFRCRLHGVCTSRAETAESARSALSFDRTYPRPEDLINDPAIDILDIATPNSAHLDALLAAARVGKPVYCDKPLTGNLDQALALADQTDCAALGQMVFHNRFFPATMRAHDIVEHGDLGDLICFRGAYLHSGNVPEGKPLAWKDMREYGAGVLYDLGTHVIDLLTWVCGAAPVEVRAMQKTLHRHRPSRTDRSVIVEQDTDDLTLVMATLSGGAVGTFEASKIATGAQDELGFEIRGTKGALRFSLMDANYLDWFDQSDPEAPLGGTAGFKRIHCVRRYAPPAGWPAPKSTIGWLRGHLHCVYSFISAVDAGLPFDPSISRGVEIERWCAGIQRAADTGQRVVL